MSIFSRYQITVPRKHPKGYLLEPKTLGEHIRKRRIDRNMSQAAVGRLLGVTKDCVWLWEDGRNTPQLHYYPAIIEFLGYYPFDHETETFGGKITRYKNEHGLNNEKLAKLPGVDEGTVAEWEKNRRIPLKRSMEKVLSAIGNTPLL